MQNPDRTINHGTLRRLVDAGAIVGAEVVGRSGGWGVVINHGRARQTLAAARGQPRKFSRFETLASYLKDLGIVEYRVNASAFQPSAVLENPADKRRAIASERMKRAHQAASYDTWFREQIRASVDDPTPSLDDDEVKKRFAAKRALLAEQTGDTKKANR